MGEGGRGGKGGEREGGVKVEKGREGGKGAWWERGKGCCQKSTAGDTKSPADGLIECNI